MPRPYLTELTDTESRELVKEMLKQPGRARETEALARLVVAELRRQGIVLARKRPDSEASP